MNLNNAPDIFNFIRQRRENLLAQGKKLGYANLATASRRLVRTLENQESVLAMDCQDGPEPVIDTSRMCADFIVSTAHRDRHGDIVEPDGCLPHIQNFTRNPRVFFAHNTSALPIASARDPEGNLCLSVDKESGLIRSTAWFHGETAESELIFRLVARKELQAASIGFLPVKAAIIENEPEHGETEAGDMVMDVRNLSGSIMHFLEWDMIEWSIVPIPANQEALAAHLGRGHIEGERITPSVRKALLAWVPPSTRTVVSLSRTPAKDIADMKSFSHKPAYKTAANPSLNSDSPVASPSYPSVPALTPRNRSQENPGAAANICAWCDRSKTAVKDSPTFPGHLTSGLKSVWNGVRAAMAALLGGKGGDDMPEQERKAAYDHLALHYQELKKEPPAFPEGGTYSEAELKTYFPDLEELSMAYEEDEDKVKTEAAEEEKAEVEPDVEEVVEDKDADPADETDEEAAKAEDTVKILKGLSETLTLMHECAVSHTDLLKGLHDKIDGFSSSQKAAAEQEEKDEEEEEMKSILDSLQVLKGNQDSLNKKLFELTGRR